MTPPPADNPQNPDIPPDIPDAMVTESRGFSLVWLIPIVAAVIGIWLGVSTILAKGPEITIAFETAEGLEAGKTQIKYREVTVGVVDTISIPEDLANIVITASMEQAAKPYLTKDSKFWVVKPRLDAGGISGLSTLVSGAYIEIEPGKGEPARAFVGLEEPPVLGADTPGGQYVLATKTLASLSPHSPIYYRGIRVGEILGHRLAKNKRHLRVHAFVKEPYNKLVRENTRFWNVSGVEVDAGADGMKIKVQSMQALLMGGVSFESLSGNLDSPMAKNGKVFQLFDSRTDVKESQITETVPYLLHFNDSVRGLSVGAPVEFRGIRIGSVNDIRFEIDYRVSRIRIAVVIGIEPQRFASAEKVGERTSPYAGARAMVERGLRAQLQTGSLISGQKLIALDMYPERPKKTLKSGGKYPEIPTIPSTLNEIAESATRILAKIEKLPLDVLINDLRTAVKSADGALSEAKDLIVIVKGDAGPLLGDLRKTTVAARKAVVRAEKTLSTIDGLAGENSDVRQQLAALLLDLTDTSRTIRALADYLEQHPDSLMRGKAGEAR